MPAGRARTIFTSAIALFCLCAVATCLSFFYFRTGERWVTHTEEVRGLVGDLESIISRAARARTGYLMAGDDTELAEYRSAASQIPDRIRRLQDLVSDNPLQVENCRQLASVIDERTKSWEESIAQKQRCFCSRSITVC